MICFFGDCGFIGIFVFGYDMDYGFFEGFYGYYEEDGDYDEEGYDDEEGEYYDDDEEGEYYDEEEEGYDDEEEENICFDVK